MNYLAHLFLSCDHDEQIVGNFIADNISRKDQASFSNDIILGIDLHKSIDTFTDTHPMVKHSTKRLHQFHRKYSPIIVDIWFDHLLTRHWESYTNESLRSFADRMYDVLQKHLHIMPAKMQQNLPLMVADDWLMRYKSVAGMSQTFERFRHRLSRPELLAGVIENLTGLDQELEADFLHFFPELIAFIQNKYH